MIYWLTGQPGSGKTTLANELAKYIENNIIIDGDNLRDILHNYEYNFEGRIKNINNVITIARFMDHKKFNVIIAVVAPYKYLRDELKKTNKVVEIYVHTNEIRGREKYFSKDYQPPIYDYIDMNTSNKSVKESIEYILNQIKIKN